MLHRDFKTLDWAEAAELFIAESDAELIRACKNAAFIRLTRDRILDRVEAAARPAEVDLAKMRCGSDTGGQAVARPAPQRSL